MSANLPTVKTEPTEEDKSTVTGSSQAGAESKSGKITITSLGSELPWHINPRVPTGNYCVFTEAERAILVRDKGADPTTLHTFTVGGKTYPLIDTFEASGPFQVEVSNTDLEAPAEWHVEIGAYKKLQVRPK